MPRLTFSELHRVRLLTTGDEGLFGVFTQSPASPRDFCFFLANDGTSHKRMVCRLSRSDRNLKAVCPYQTYSLVLLGQPETDPAAIDKFLDQACAIDRVLRGHLDR